MTINEAAIRLLAYFSPEERSIPDHASYPGRNGAVGGALNAALQHLFAKSGPWVRKDERGALLNPPTEITVTVTHGSASATISTGWFAWMEGCSIIIDGHDVENQIRKAIGSGTHTLTLKIPYGGTSGDQTATVYQDSITIGDDVLEVNDPVKANGLQLSGMVSGGGPSQRIEVNDYGAAGFMTNPSQIAVTSTGNPLFYSVVTWTKDATTRDGLRMAISPAPASSGTLTYDVLLLPPEVGDLASTNELPIPFGMADSVFIPIATMKLFATPFFRNQQVSQSIADQYRLAMDQLANVDPQKKSPTFTTLG